MGPLDAVTAAPAIRVQALSYNYPNGPRALVELTFDVAAGESVALVGPNAAGKRTIGLDPSDSVQRRQLPTRVGIVFQNSDDQIFNTTVFDDVAFGPLNLGLPADEVRRRVAEALERVGLAGADERVPFHLSGGEKRRVALAGVLAMRPDVLLLDEPSMHLDPRGRREFIQFVNGLAVTKMVASHDLELVLRTCKRTLVLDAGQLVADGATRELLGDRALMEAHGLEVPHSLTPHGVQHRHD
jgi:cobalt/nickel transport system ATP-binding protein